MNKRINSLWKLCLITIVLFSWTTESNAQFITSEPDQSKILSPIVKIVSDVLLRGKLKITNIENEVVREKSYLNSSLFFFKENIQVCRDILTETKNSIDTLNISFQEQTQTKKDTSLKEVKIRVIEKKKHKSFWNHPGNTKSRI